MVLRYCVIVPYPDKWRCRYGINGVTFVEIYFSLLLPKWWDPGPLFGVELNQYVLHAGVLGVAWSACNKVQYNQRTSTLQVCSSLFKCDENFILFHAKFGRDICINSLWSSDAIWRYRSGSTSAQVMACCLTAPSYYLNQCWLNISVVLWHSAENNFTRNAQDIFPWYQFENYWFKTSTTSSRGQWVKMWMGAKLPLPIGSGGWERLWAWINNYIPHYAIIMLSIHALDTCFWYQIPHFMDDGH